MEVLRPGISGIKTLLNELVTIKKECQLIQSVQFYSDLYDEQKLKNEEMRQKMEIETIKGCIEKRNGEEKRRNLVVASLPKVYKQENYENIK